MVDRDNNSRWNENRDSEYSARRPGGNRDFYNRDERSEDDYGVGYGEEGVTNYRLRDQMQRPGQARQGGSYGSGAYRGGSYEGGNYGGVGASRGGWNQDQGDFARGPGSREIGYGRSEYGNPTNYSPSYDRDYRGGYNQGQRYGEQHSSRDNNERGFWDRATDEVSSWFGDDEAERRRRQDARHQGVGPKGYRRSDERIREDVSDRLTDDPYINASNVEVQVENAEVTLTGQVDSRNARRRAEDLAERVSGVTHVQNNLRVTSGAEMTREEREAGAAKAGVFGTPKA